MGAGEIIVVAVAAVIRVVAGYPGGGGYPGGEIARRLRHANRLSDGTCNATIGRGLRRFAAKYVLCVCERLQKNCEALKYSIGYYPKRPTARTAAADQSARRQLILLACKVVTSYIFNPSGAPAISDNLYAYQCARIEELNDKGRDSSC